MKENDDALSASRYALMMRRHGLTDRGRVITHEGKQPPTWDKYPAHFPSGSGWRFEEVHETIVDPKHSGPPTYVRMDSQCARFSKIIAKDKHECAAGNDDHHHPKDIYKQVTALSTRNFGLSAEVGRGTRPAHKAGKLTGQGIDSPDSVQFKKHRDYR